MTLAPAPPGAASNLAPQATKISSVPRFIGGFMLLLGLHVVACVAAAGMIVGLASLEVIKPDYALLAMAPPLAIGGLQLVYVVPLLLVAWRRGFGPFAYGIVACAALTFMLNAACWGLLSLSMAT